MKKVFASDFDGTLYFYRAEVKLPPESVKKIKEYQAAGNLFGLCTGRQVGGLTPFITGHIEPDFYITSSGANIIDKDMREIQKCGIDRKIAAAMVKEINPQKYKITLDIEGDICVFTKMDYPGNYYVITGVDDAPAGRIHQVSIHTQSPEEATAMAKRINQNYGDDVEAFQNVAEVDIAPKGCSKGKGIGVLWEYVREQLGECKLYGIGDSMNDLSLIEAADVSYTFPYAPKELQERATKVVENICEALEDSMTDA